MHVSYLFKKQTQIYFKLIISVLVCLFFLFHSQAQDLSDCSATFTFTQNDVSDGSGNRIDIVIVEFEDVPDRGGLGDWSFRDANLLKNNGDPFDDDFSGEGYLFYEGSDFFQDGGNALIEYNIEIEDPGVYRFVYNSAIGLMNVPGTEHNDAWVKFPDADAFYGYRQANNSIAIPNDEGINPENPDPNDPILKATFPDASYKVPEGSDVRNKGFMKIFMNQLEGWWYEGATSDNEGHLVYVRFDNPGSYTMQISGRSNGFAIDRAVLWKEEGGFAGLNNRNLRRAAFMDLNATAPACILEPLSFQGTKASATEVSLTWIDNAVSETGFELQTSESEAFTTILSTETVGANVEQVAIDGLTEGTTYFFRGRTLLNGSDSDFTETVEVKTNIKPTITADLVFDVEDDNLVVFPIDSFLSVFSEEEGESLEAINILSLPDGIQVFQMGFLYGINNPRVVPSSDLTSFQGEQIFRYRANNQFSGTTSFSFSLSDGFDFAETPRVVQINVLKAEIEVTFQGEPLVDRADFDFGDVPVGVSLPFTFKIENVGGKELRLRDLPLTITNRVLDQYAITQQPNRSTLQPGQSTEFVVSFQPTTTGAKNNAQIVVLNSDFDQNDKDFRIDLFGRGVIDETAPSFVSGTEESIAENTTEAYEAKVDERVFFTLGSEKDESLFEIDSDRLDTIQTLQFILPPDFENPSDSDSDNVYLVDLIGTDLAGFSVTQCIAITVTDVSNEANPMIISPLEVTVPENTEGVFYTVMADKTASFALGSTKDEGLFSLVESELSFASPPDFESPNDMDSDNVYLIDLTASDSDGSTTETLTIMVVDVEPETEGEGIVISVSNQLSLNGDRINDEWIIQPFPGIETSRIRVFNKSGVVVFSSVGYEQPWDGIFNGNFIPEGIYYYLIEASSEKKSGYLLVTQ